MQLITQLTAKKLLIVGLTEREPAGVPGHAAIWPVAVENQVVRHRQPRRQGPHLARGVGFVDRVLPHPVSVHVGNVFVPVVVANDGSA